MPLELRLEIASMQREIAHMEADLSFHRSQIQLFGQEIMRRQKKLQKLHRFEENHSMPHSPCEENEYADFDEEI